ncbi:MULTISPECIES: RidA family protein [Rhodococcus]|uniref:RidA family protein n=1 Tax=Rhodococcus TaxID=1827 RepID=UPI00076197AD|nr:MULTISPECIES: RidA family protein [Rhodococcus]BDB62691.1 reactive intermediate/imine deaminase [Rhodococcus sp. RDE2]
MTRPSLVAERELIRVPSIAASAPYSPAVALGNLVWTSGALPTEQDGTVSDDFRTQVRTALHNLGAFLREAGADWSTVLKINGYVKDIEQLPALNEVYASIVTVHGAPARTTVEVSRFRGRTQVEFDAVAFRRIP